MILRLLFSAFMLCVAQLAFSQGTVRGKITDNLGESIIGGTVVFKSNPSNGVVSDFDGNYSIEIDSPDPVELVYGFIGMETILKTVNPKNGEIVIVNVDMIPKNFDLEGVVIEAKANRGGDYYMEKIKKNSATSIDYISKETIKKIGDSQVSSAIQRVTGVSSVAGFVTVRGLADRYVVTTVNGGRIPTLDPFTNNINLDIIPSGLVDNLVITKTGSPDLPGDFAGAYISVETQDYPDQLTVSAKTSIGVNLNASFQDIISSERSDTDWLGWDDGFRDIPDIAPLDPEEYPEFNRGTNPYDQFSYLGIESDLNAYGITAESSIPVGSPLYQVGLFELGFLSGALFGDEASVDAAIKDYNDTYGTPYFLSRLNRELSSIGQAFPNNWAPIETQGGMLFSQSFTVGNQTKLFGKTLGYNFGFRYATAVQADNEARIARTLRSKEAALEGLPEEVIANGGSQDVRASQESSNLSALINFSYKLNQHNSISLLFMPNITGQNQARIGSGFVEDIPEFSDRPEQFYEERRQLIYQFSSTHFIPSLKGKLTTDFSYTDGFRNAPNFIAELPLFYEVNPETGERNEFPVLLNTSEPNRRYRQLEDDILDVHVNYSMPLFQEAESVASLKFGGSYFENNRNSQQYIFVVKNTTQIPLTSGLNGYLRPENFEITEESSSNPLYYTNESNVTDSDVGFKKVWAAYAMTDYNITTRFRAVGGLRVEVTDLLSDIQEFRDRGLPADHPDRRIVGRTGIANPSTINETHLLPSVNLIYKLRENEITPLNLRFNYFRSLARPSFREISIVRLFDYEYQGEVQGNDDLEITTVENLDVRLENFMDGGNSISISGFYKYFQNHIELIQEVGGNGAFTWINADESFATGIELEGIWNVRKNLEFRTNFSYIYSETNVTQGDTAAGGTVFEDTRPMFGQAPWIINAMLSHNWEKLGITSTVSYNVQGPRLATIVNASVAIPDVYEMPRHLIDIKLAKTLGEHFVIDFRVRNLLNSPVRRAYEFDAGFDQLDFDRYAWGTSLILGLSFNL